MSSPYIPPVQDRKPHLYTAIVTPDNKVRILVDGEEKKTADLLSPTDFREPINPPEMVDDPEDSKPADWVDSPKMDNPLSVKPDDWDDDAPVRIEDPNAIKPAAWEDDEPLQVPDPSASAPADWDEDEDGEWEAPLVPNPKCKPAGCGVWKPPIIPNPAYKGKWKPEEIDNPDYKGPWKARQIPNPSYYYDDAPHDVAPIGGVGIELWTMQDGILFDNILIAADPEVAASAAAQTFELRLEAAKAAERDVERQPGVMGLLQYAATTAIYFVEDNAMPVAVAVVAVLLSLAFFLCRSRPADDLPPSDTTDDAVSAGASSSQEPSAESEEAAAAAEDDDDEEEEEEEAEIIEEKPQKKPTTRRTRKARD